MSLESACEKGRSQGSEKIWGKRGESHRIILVTGSKRRKTGPLKISKHSILIIPEVNTPPKCIKRGSREAEVLPQEMEGNGDPSTKLEQEQEEFDEGASEEQKELSSQDFEKWKLEWEFKFKELQLRAEEETKQRELEMRAEQEAREMAAEQEAIAKWPNPTSKKQVHSFLGLPGYYWRFIPHFSAIAAPLSDLTRKKEPEKISWTPECQQ